MMENNSGIKWGKVGESDSTSHLGGDKQVITGCSWASFNIP